MTIVWTKLVPALLLLLVPGDIFNGRKIRYREVSRHWEGYWSRTLTHGVHTIDFVRAAFGAWLLHDALIAAPHAAGFRLYEAPLLDGGVRVLAVILQTVVCRERDSCNAPFTFVAGLLLGGASPIVAVLSLALAVPVALGTMSPAAFFFTAAMAHLAVGLWFEGKPAVLRLSFGSIAASVPFFWHLMFRHELVVAYRLKRASTDEPHAPLR